MAYNLYVFRGKNWWEGTTEPITAEELLAVSGVTSADKISSTNPQTGAVISVSGDGMYSYKEAYLSLRKGMLTFAVRDESDAEIIRPVADALKAVIQGEEGEYY